jgi:hypothetical protein
MNTIRLMAITLFIIFSIPAFGQSINGLKPSDGSSVKLEGFTVSMRISDIPDFDSYTVLIMVEVWNGSSFEWNSDGAFNNGGHCDGTNIKYLVPDVCFANDDSTPTDLLLVAKVGPLVNGNHEGPYPATSGDEIRVTAWIYGYVGADWHQAQKEVFLTVR